MFERQADEPLFANVLWNRPVSAHAAGRLLVVGAHNSGLATLQAVYQIAEAAGIGSLTMLVPETLRSMLAIVPAINFAPATIAGSLAKASLSQMVELASYTDAVLVGTDLSNNSETAILIESFIAKYDRPLIIADAALEVIGLSPDLIRSRPNTLVVLTMQQLFKLAGKLGLPLQIKPDGGITNKIEIVTDFWSVLKVDLALIGPEIIIKTGDQVSVTELSGQPATLLPTAYGVLSVFYTQNPKAHYEGLTTGAFLLSQAINSTTEISIANVTASLTKALQERD